MILEIFSRLRWQHRRNFYRVRIRLISQIRSDKVSLLHLGVNLIVLSWMSRRHSRHGRRHRWTSVRETANRRQRHSSEKATLVGPVSLGRS